jgi:hypothetical protein
LGRCCRVPESTTPLGSAEPDAAASELTRATTNTITATAARQIANAHCSFACAPLSS